MKYQYSFYLSFLLLLLAGCRKTEFAGIESPSYLRVFNCLDITTTIDNKDAPLQFLVMLIDPQLDKDGIPETAAITGDFLDKRDAWARPYPDAVNTTLYQKEYPGTLKVLAAPILNGYDLSSWAQVPSGKHRVIFRTRPYSQTPFFNLEKSLRGATIIDTTIDLQPREVYTMHVLQQDFLTRKTGLYLRNETFVKQSLSDSMVYVNFYNLSPDGFFENAGQARNPNEIANRSLRDTMSIYYTLQRFNNGTNLPVTGFNNLPLGIVKRSLQPHVNTYYSFPLFADTSAAKIFTGNMSQRFTFCAPGLTPEGIPWSFNLAEGMYSAISMGDYGSSNASDGSPFLIRADLRTGLIVSIHSGKNNPRSFATVNTVEYINKKFYLTTIQRKFEPPIY